MHYYSTEFTESVVIVLLISRSERVRRVNIEDSYYHIPARYIKITAKQVVIWERISNNAFFIKKCFSVRAFYIQITLLQCCSACLQRKLSLTSLWIMEVAQIKRLLQRLFSDDYCKCGMEDMKDTVRLILTMDIFWQSVFL